MMCMFVLSGASLGMHLWRIGDAETGGRCTVCNVFVYLFVCFKYVLYVFVYVCTFWCIYGELEMHRQEGGVTGVYVL